MCSDLTYTHTRTSGRKSVCATTAAVFWHAEPRSQHRARPRQHALTRPSDKFDGHRRRLNCRTACRRCNERKWPTGALDMCLSYIILLLRLSVVSLFYYFVSLSRFVSLPVSFSISLSLSLSVSSLLFFLDLYLSLSFCVPSCLFLYLSFCLFVCLLSSPLSLPLFHFFITSCPSLLSLPSVSASLSVCISFLHCLVHLYTVSPSLSLSVSFCISLCHYLVCLSIISPSVAFSLSFCTSLFHYLVSLSFVSPSCSFSVSFCI
jgi:hypothetical protein